MGRRDQRPGLPGGRHRRSRASAPVASLVLLLAGGVFLAPGCLIVDPPPSVPDPPTRRPTILRSQAVPPPSRTILELPRQFVVPVEVIDRNQEFEWRVFVDYDVLATPQEAFETGGTSKPGTDADAGNPAVRLIAFSVRSDRFGDIASVRGCHVIEFLAAEQFTGQRDRAFQPPLGGDSIVWFVNSGGDLAGCPVFDGGVPDASSDAADGAG